MKPLAIELFAGLFGWGDGLVAEGYETLGFDIVNMFAELGIERPPHCNLVLQDVLTLHGKQFKDAALIVASPPCQAYSYRAMPWSRAKALPPPDNALFDACFRIQREACEAAGHYIPMVVENVRGAQKWVGRSRWNYGSYHLWGDVPALMPMVAKRSLMKAGLSKSLDWRENGGGSWFNVAHNTTSGKGQNPDGRKCGGAWFGAGNDCSVMRQHSSKSKARKAASAAIAKIPFAPAQHIAAYWKPQQVAA